MQHNPRIGLELGAAALALMMLATGCSEQQDLAGPRDAAPDNTEVSSEYVPTLGTRGGAAAVTAVPAAHSPEELDGADEPINPELLVTDALETCGAARVLFEQGNTDAALSRLVTLDLAYEMLLQMPAGDPKLVQEKEDLRHLISRRIVEIYRSRPASAAKLGSPIPLVMNEHIEYEITRFQGGERDFFLEAYRRSGQYRPMIVRMLREAGLPEELSWLPLVESGFKTRALSRARALGMWQFISSTGSRYGLSRGYWVDERMDPESSTRAAIEYLTELHGMFGDWMTALAGYNCGEHRVAREIQRQDEEYFDHFWDLYAQLPRETARYVPRFLATLMIVQEPERYGFDLPEPLPPASYETASTHRHMKLEDLDRALGLKTGALAALNPELRRGFTPESKYGLHVPPTVVPVFDARLAAMPSEPPPEKAPASKPPKGTSSVHRVKPGETLSEIAQLYGTTVSAMVSANNLSSAGRIRSGQRLKVPAKDDLKVALKARKTTKGKSKPITHTVRSGHSLWFLAAHYGTTVDRIKSDNNLGDNRLYPGQQLAIHTTSAAGNRTYKVRRGDTIGKIAREHRVSLTKMQKANGLSRSSRIFPDQVLVIPN